MDERLNDIEARHDELEQYTRELNLVILGIPEHEDQLEDNVANVVTLGKLLQVNSTPDKDKPRPIIARFNSYNAKSKLYKARLQL